MHSRLEVLHGNLSNIGGIGGSTQGLFLVLVFSLIAAFDPGGFGAFFFCVDWFAVTRSHSVVYLILRCTRGGLASG